MVRRSPNRQFNCVPTDQALEQTVNREAKSHGGIISFTLRKGALLRWLLTRHMSLVSMQMQWRLCTPTPQSRPDIHEELGSSGMRRDASDVGKIIDALEGQYQNPFDLDCAHFSDQHCNWTGCNTRSGGITIKTFAVMRKPLLTDKQKKLMCSNEVLFRRLLSVSNTTDIDIQKVLEHELAAVPPQFSTTMAQGEILISLTWRRN